MNKAMKVLCSSVKSKWLIKNLVVGAFLALGVSEQANATTFNVTNTNDSGAGSLRQAIIDANANPGPDNIEFNIAGAGVHTITPISILPDIESEVFIDGLSQPDASPGNLLIELSGQSAVGGVTVDGVNYASEVGDFGTTNVSGPLSIVGDGTGTDPAFLACDFDPPPLGSLTGAIALIGRGSCSFSEKIRNVQNAGAVGVIVVNNVPGPPFQMPQDGTPDQPTITAYMVGQSDLAVLLTKGGTLASLIPNLTGLVFSDGSSNSTGQGLVINRFATGILTTIGGNEIKIKNNYIGTDATGTIALGNLGDGVQLQTGDNTVEGNLISGNGRAGITSFNFGGNTIKVNMIGTDVTGTAALPNSIDGIQTQTGDNTIEGNLISGNGRVGIVLNDEGNNTIKANKIGTDFICFDAVVTFKN
jgi:parallel beta-helix repeat protein